MKLSDISSQKLSPGRYLITASYDGDIEYNPAEAQLVLTIDESGEAHIDVQPIDDEGAMQVVKVEPDISFTTSTLDIVEKNLEEYPFDWKAYLSNPKDVPYSLYTSTGLELDEYQRLCWNASGTYVLTLITTETDLYLSKTINLTLNITAKVNPQIEYVNDNEQFTLENGNFTKRYRNIEKREGVFMFDLLQPTNPYGLPLKYKISDEKHGAINTDDNKIYLSEEGKYKITAYYEGDDTYRSSITYYILKYYEGEEPADDEPDTTQRKQNPNLSFASSNVTQNKEDDNKYKVLALINPYSVTGGTWVVSKGSITYDGTIITYDDIGSITVSYIFNGDDKYNAQTASYILNITSEDNPDNLPVPDVGFNQAIVTVDENEAHEYQIQAAYNNSGVAINYYYNDELIENGILKTTNTGNLRIVGITENNGTFASTKIYYTLRIIKYQAQDPEISFDQDNVKEYQSSNYEYLLQFVNNPHNVELEWSCNNGVITDNILYCEDLGTIIITVKSKTSFYYSESTISYTLIIEESSKLSPELSFDEEAQFFNGNGTLQYPVQAVNNPHNVELRWFSDRGELNSEMNPTYLTISAYSGPINIYCKSIEDESYKSEMVSYKLFVGATRKYLQYTKHADYTIERNQGTFDLEMLRYNKSQELEFDPTEWTFTSSLQSYCTINEKYYIEEDDYIVVMANLTFKKPCNPLISISFSGNDYFYNTSGIRVHVNLTGKDMADPEISFANSYEITDLRDDYKYLLQDVNNPHNVEIVYSSSAGTVQGNVLTYQDKYNVIIKATSIEDDTYASKTISYKLEFQEPQKPSSGIHFPLNIVTVTQTNEGIYELQGLLDDEDQSIADPSLLGRYDSNLIGDITYDDNRGCYIIEKPNWNGNATIKFIIYETATYRKETISYKLTILSNEKPSPNLAFDNYQINVTQNSNGTYPLQALINPNNVPVTWFCSKGEFDDPNNPQNIIFSDREYIRIGVRSEETANFKSQEQAYGMSIILPSKKDAGLSFDKYQLATQRNDEGIYPLQKVNNPNNVSPLTYSVNKGRIEGDNIIYDGIGMLTITVSYPGDDVYEAVNLRYTYDIGGQFKKYLEVENCQSVEMTGELNEDIEVQLVRWNAAKDYTFNINEWYVTSSHFRCTYKTIRTEEINGYVYLIGKFSFKAEGTSYITVRFLGNDDFYNDEGHGLWLKYSVPTVVDNRVLPSISFNKYMLYVTQNENYMYLLQSLNKPDDVEIEHWEINYGGDDSETAKIIDDEYVYYEGTDYVNVKVFTKESDIYKPTSDSYSLYVNEKTKTGTSIYFIWDKINAKRTLDGIYNIQSAHISPSNLPVVWSTSKGTLTDNNTKLNYSDVGEVTITCSFEENDDYEASTASYKLIISSQYVQRDLNATKYGDQHLIVDYTTEYDIPLIKWPLTENLEYDPAEWLFTGDNETKWNLVSLFTIDDEEYCTLYAKMTFNQNGNTYYTLKLQNNAFFYDNRWQAEIYFEKPAQEKINPQISWPNPNLGNVDYREDNKYLIQTPISEYDDVEFNVPYSGKTVIKEGDNYYIQYSSTGPVDVFVSNIGTNKYYSVTISYRFTIVAPQVKPTYALSFNQSTFNRNKSKDNEYNLLTPSTNGDVNQLQWKSDKDDCTIDAVNKKVYWSGTGAIKITAYYPETENYGYVEASYNMVVSEAIQKTYLQSSEYKSQTIEVALGAEYDIPIIKWPLTENLDFDEEEWYLSNSYSTKCVVDHLFTVDDGEYRILKARCTFTTSGSTYLKIRFLGNDYFYSSNYNGFELYFNRDPNIVLIDPMISWPEEEQTFEQTDDNKYLIQTPVSEYQDVEFYNPKVSRGVVVQENENFYVQATGLNDIVVTIKNLSNNVYVSKTISYTIKLTEKQIIKEDSELSFANSVDNVEYIWQIGEPKYYKLQPLHNPYDISVTFKVNKKLIGGNSKTYLENGYIDYNYYVEVDGIEDVIINCIGQENDYYYITSNPSYTMHIQRTGQIVDMYFAQSLVNYSLNSNGYHKLQEVTLSEEISDIRNNIVYNVDGSNATIKKQSGIYYLITNTPGNYTIRATYQGDGTYASTESSYEVTIVEVTKKNAPIYFSEDAIYTLEQESNIYPLQIPSCSDNSFDFGNILIWNLPSGWSLVGTNGITSSQPIEENTTLHIECSIPETEEYYGKTIQYDLIIQAKVYLGVTVHDNYENELKEFGVLEQEVLRWPVSQNVSYVESEWTLTCQTSPQKDAFYSSLTHHVVNGYHVLYIYYLATFYGTITVNLNYSGNSNVHSGQYGLYIRLKQYVKPESEKDDPEICWTQGDYIEVDSTQNQKYNRPQITNPHSVTCDIYYQQATPKVSGSTITDYTQLNLIGEKYNWSGTNISFQGEGYIVFSLVSISNSDYYSVTDYIVMYIRKDPNAPAVPTQTPRFSISPINMSVDYNEENKYPLPTITNTDNVEYHVYSPDKYTEIFPENGYVTLSSSWGKKYVYFITTPDDTFVSKTITVQYDVKDPRPKLKYEVKMGKKIDNYSIFPNRGYYITGHIYREPNTFNCYDLDEINTPIGDGFANMQFYIRWKTSDYNIDENVRYVIHDYYYSSDSNYPNYPISGYYEINTNIGWSFIIRPTELEYYTSQGIQYSNITKVEPLLCGGVYLYKEGEYTYLLLRLYLPDREKYELGYGFGSIKEYKENEWRDRNDIYDITVEFGGYGTNFQRSVRTFESVEFRRLDYIKFNHQPDVGAYGLATPLKYADTKYLKFNQWLQGNKLVENLNNLNSITWKESKMANAYFYPGM